jgi:hypothetical protein
MLPVLDLVAESAPVPYSERESIALVSESRACVVDSYEVRILCGGREWVTPTIVGTGEGDGPGELRIRATSCGDRPGRSR